MHYDVGLGLGPGLGQKVWVRYVESTLGLENYTTWVRFAESWLGLENYIARVRLTKSGSGN